MIDAFQQVEDLLARRDLKKAEVQIARSLRAPLTPLERARMLIYRARTRLLSARPDDALDDVQSARALAPDHLDTAPTFELLGDCYFARFELASVGFADRNDTAQAIHVYQQIRDQFPDYENLGWVFYQMGRVLLTENRTDEAARCFEQALLNPSTLAALTAYCFERLAFVAFYETRQPGKALGFINKAVDTYPITDDRRWLVGVHILRSRILRDMRRFDQALKAAEIALAVAGTGSNESKAQLAEALLTSGELLYGIEGREREVITHLQQFLQLSRKPLGVDVTWSRVHEMLGDAYFKTGQYATAAAAHQAALQFNPYHPWELSLHYRIARSHYQTGDYDRAVQSIHRLLDSAEKDGQPVTDYRVFDILGNAQFALKRYDEALAAYRTALSIAPPNAENLEKIRTYHNYAAELSGAF